MALDLTKNAEFQRIMNAVAAGTSTQTSSAIDMQGYDRATVLLIIGTITSGAALSIKLQQSDDDGSTDAYDDLAGSSVSIADTNSNKIVPYDIVRPLKRYVKVVVTRSTQNVVIDGMVVIKQGAMKKPIVQGSTVAASAISTGAEEGTA